MDSMVEQHDTRKPLPDMVEDDTFRIDPGNTESTMAVAEGITPDCPNRCTRMHPETRMSRG